VAGVFGVSTQSSEYQAEVHKRLHLPYDLLSDQELRLQEALELPTFDWEGGKVFRRMTVAIEGGMVIKVWYPVFPPDKATEDIVTWLRERTSAIREPPAGMVATDHVA
jgi:peroxiredoxin